MALAGRTRRGAPSRAVRSRRRGARDEPCHAPDPPSPSGLLRGTPRSRVSQPARARLRRAAGCPRHRPASHRRRDHTRTVPTGTVPDPRGDAERTGNPATRFAEERNRTGGLAPCRPFRCGSCWKPAFTSATRRAAGIPRCARSSSPSATGSTSSISPRPSSAWMSPGVRARDGRSWRIRAVRRDKEAGPGADPPGGEPGRPAIRQQALARRHAHQLLDDQEADLAPRAARGQAAGGRLRADDQEGSREADRRDDEARRSPSAACAR